MFGFNSIVFRSSSNIDLFRWSYWKCNGLKMIRYNICIGQAIKKPSIVNSACMTLSIARATNGQFQIKCVFHISKKALLDAIFWFSFFGKLLACGFFHCVHFDVIEFFWFVVCAPWKIQHNKKTCHLNVRNWTGYLTKPMDTYEARSQQHMFLALNHCYCHKIQVSILIYWY